MTNFEILRPYAFLFLIPLLFLCVFQSRILHKWKDVIDPRLTDALLVKRTDRKRRIQAGILMFAAFACAVFAMAGIKVREIDGSLYRPTTPAILMLDLSQSMRAKDVPPSRFSAAIFKTYDLLKELNGLPVGLIVFSAEPYVITPATTDSSVIEKHLPLMNFNLMPSQGTVYHRAIDEALKLLKSTGASSGDVFLLTDGGEDNEDLEKMALQSAKALSKNGGRLFVLGFGTQDGAFLTDKNDRLMKDVMSRPVKHAIREDFLKKLASAGKGAYASVSPHSNEDVLFLIQAQKRTYLQTQKTDFTGKTAVDEGYWFLLPLLILFPFFLVRGRLGVIAFLLCFPAFSARADGGALRRFFIFPYDEIQAKIERMDFDGAQAASLKTNDFDIIYNTGTTFIYKGKYQNAADTLSVAVRLKPDDENAAVNYEIALRLLKQKNQGDGGDNGSGGERGQNDDEKGKQGDADNGERPEQQDGSDDQADNDNTKNGGNIAKGAGDTHGKSGQPDAAKARKDAESQDGGIGDDNARENKENNENQQDKGNSSSNSSTDELQDNAVSANSEQSGGDKPSDRTLKRVREDPAALLKYKINAVYSAGRYQDEDIGEVEPW